MLYQIIVSSAYFKVQGNFFSVVAYVLDDDFEVSRFELQSCRYVHFQINNLGAGVNLLIP